MLAFLAPLLNSVFGQAFGSFVEGYKAKLASENTQESIAANLAARELAVQQAEIQAQTQLRIAEIGRWYEPDHLFLYALFVYFLYGLADSLAGYPVPTLTPELSQWAGVMIVFLFGKRGIENVVRILKR